MSRHQEFLLCERLAELLDLPERVARAASHACERKIPHHRIGLRPLYSAGADQDQLRVHVLSNSTEICMDDTATKVISY